MNSQMKGLLISLGTMQMARKVPTDRPDVLMAIRVSYVVVVLLQAAVYYIISLKIKKRNDTTVLKVVEPPKPFAQNPAPGEPTITTNRDYDLQQISKQWPGLGIGLVIMGVMHLKFGYTQPLLLQSIMPLKSLYDNPEVQIWLLGRKAEGDLARPFKAAPGLMSALQEATNESNEATNATAVATDTPKIQEIVEDEPKKSK